MKSQQFLVVPPRAASLKEEKGGPINLCLYHSGGREGGGPDIRPNGSKAVNGDGKLKKKTQVLLYGRPTRLILQTIK